MRIIPDSTINLYSNIPIDNGEQLAFSTQQKQTEYFLSHLVRSETPCTVVKKTGELKVSASMLIVSTCNYISFVNPSFDNRTVYARIIDYDYVNNETTSIVYAIDMWQTWMFDVTFENMYIEREHLSNESWALAETNPYDIRIAEFRTGENLNINGETEKYFYDIAPEGDQNPINDYDGYKIGAIIDDETGADNTLGILLKMSEIDFEDLDADITDPTKKPSLLFKNYLLNRIQTQNLGYWALPFAMYEYLHGLYPSDINQNTFIGTGWSVGGTPVNPFNSNQFRTNCAYIYDPLAGTGQSTMGQLLSDLVRWNCVSAIVDMLVIPNDMMLTAGVDVENSGAMAVSQKTVKTELTVTNKKLMLFPFSYLRLITPNGDIKELHFEDFKNVQQGGDVCQVSVILDITDKPNLIIAPYQYKMSGVGNTSLNNYNIHEALYFKQFPTAPYNIDAFLAQVANASYDVIKNSTFETYYNLMESENNVSDEAIKSSWVTKVGAALAVAGGAVSGYSMGESNPVASKLAGGVPFNSQASGVGRLGIVAGSAGLAQSQGAFSEGVGIEWQRRRNELTRGMMEDARNIANHSATEVVKNLAFTRAAYACNKYVPSNGVGLNNYNIVACRDIIYQRVTLNNVMLERYDNYFTHYGYTSGRCGIPRVINFIHGLTANTPHWLTLNGKETTYVKTTDCKVIHSMVGVADAIKTMFDSGVRFIKGDLS